MTLDEIMRDIQALREDLLVFERKYGAPTEVFYEAYQRGEEPDDPAWVLDWSEWAATQQLLQDRFSVSPGRFLSCQHESSSQTYPT
jgi:hypothetical protein